MLNFLDEINQTDIKLQSKVCASSSSKNIFGDPEPSYEAPPNTQFASFLEQKHLAENERLKGNECMKSKDFQDAIDCYTKAIEICSTDAATYSNRALAYLKQKEYARALEDAD